MDRPKYAIKTVVRIRDNINKVDKARIYNSAEIGRIFGFSCREATNLLYDGGIEKDKMHAFKGSYVIEKFGKILKENKSMLEGYEGNWSQY
jgi:hypothetical protein